MSGAPVTAQWPLKILRRCAVLQAAPARVVGVVLRPELLGQ